MIFADRPKAMLLLWILFRYLCFMIIFVMMSCLFLAALWSWERADLLALLCVEFSCIFVTFPYGVQGQVWYLIVLIPDVLRIFPCSLE